ncbi:MAG: hypothetical protein LBO71_04920 [Prevotellaceae bacterium]|nr:hypothetical protein [Prevotellaceae bacterium]
MIFVSSLPAAIRSLPPFAPCRHSERSEESPRTPPCRDGRNERRRVACGGRYAGRFLRSARSCLARSGRNDGCEGENDGRE